MSLVIVSAWSGVVSASEACNELKQVELQMRQLVGALKSDSSKPAHFKRQLLVAQKAWEQSVKQQIRLAYSAPKPLQEYGTVYDDCVCALKANYYTQRIQELKRYQKEVPDGEVCAVPGL